MQGLKDTWEDREDSGAQYTALAGEAGPGTVCGWLSRERGWGVTFNLNSELYADPNLAEGVDYARRHRRHERFDDILARTDDVPKTTILAPHGGGIEPGTSELSAWPWPATTRPACPRSRPPG